MFAFSHGESPSPKRPRRDRRDLDVFAARWKWLGPVHTSFFHGASLPPNRPGHNRRHSGVSAAVWEWLNLVYPRSPTGRPYLSSARGRAGGTRVYA